LPSKEVSFHGSRSCSSRAPSNARHSFSQTPSSSHCFSRQQVAGEPPRRSGLQNPQDAFATCPVRCPRSASVVPPTLRLGKQRLNSLPLFIR
jgi:hypothetical protein